MWLSINTENPDGLIYCVLILGVTVFHRQLLEISLTYFGPLSWLCLESWILSKGWKYPGVEKEQWEEDMVVPYPGSLTSSLSPPVSRECAHTWASKHTLIFSRASGPSLICCWEIKAKFVGILGSRITLSICLNTQ